jgi:hypothetical protein
MELTTYILVIGDMSVGILNEQYQVDNIQIIDRDHREEVREAFQKCFATICGAPLNDVKVRFSDELID